MQKLVVNKQMLADFDYLLLVLENCDCYQVAVADILDIYCVAEKSTANSIYRATEGFVKISHRASQTKECLVIANDLVGTETDIPLCERFEMCDGGADVVAVALKKSGAKDIDIYVPYDPLISITGGEIELSNCPSLKFDEQGNMTFAFGKSSTQPIRKDNNYSQLVEGWQQAFGTFQPQQLTARITRLENFGIDTTNVLLAFTIKNKGYHNKMAQLVFMDCRDLELELSFPSKGDCDICMSKLSNGNIYVGLNWFNVQFVCKRVLEYEYYCNQTDD